MKPPRIIPAANPSPPTVFLGISGILHPSESTYGFLRGCSPWTDGHSKFEAVPILEECLARWPDVRLVLTSALSSEGGLDEVLRRLGTSLAARVAGHTFEDLTKVVKREVRTRSGTKRTVGYSSEDYWRMNKSEIVATHVAWSRPERWIVIDNEDILWPQAVRRDRLVLTDGCEGLRGARERDRLQTVLLMNFVD